MKISELLEMEFEAEASMPALDGINFDEYKTKAGAAKAAYEAICAYVRELGMDPEHEVWIKNPEESREHGYTTSWHVCWESGPYQWAIGRFISGPWGFCETHWGFDLIFTE